MQTLTGHYYQLSLGLQGSLAASSDWLPSPLMQRYHVDVISVSNAVKQADGSYTATVVVKWTGDIGLINHGDTITSDVNYVSPIPVAVGASAVVMSVVDLGTVITSAGSSFTTYLLALGIVAYTVVLARQIVKPPARRAA
jgi:hypothetical protein